MLKYNYFTYLGVNGTIHSQIELQDIYNIKTYLLIAEDGKVLTNGEIKCKSIEIPIKDLDKWKEIDDGQ